MKFASISLTLLIALSTASCASPAKHITEVDAVETTKPPRLLNYDCARIAYPPEAEKANESGVVVVSLLVGPDGSVAEEKLKTPSGSERLDSAALTAARSCRFEPPERNGQPVATWAVINYNFTHSQMRDPLSVSRVVIGVRKYVDALSAACAEVDSSNELSFEMVREQWHMHNDSIGIEADHARQHEFENLAPGQHGESPQEVAARLEQNLQKSTDAAASNSVNELIALGAAARQAQCSELRQKLSTGALDISMFASQDYRYLQSYVAGMQSSSK